MSSASPSGSQPRYEGKVKTLKSCSECRVRKIKCDLVQKRAEIKNEQTQDNVQCSACSRQGLSCTSKPVHTKVKVRQGKRIEALREQGSQLDLQPPSKNQISPAASSSASASTSSPQSYFSNQSTIQTNGVPSFRSIESRTGKGKSRDPGMFGLSGLNRQILDAAISSFFLWAAAAMPMVRKEIFIPRLRLLIKQYSGEEIHQQLDPNVIDSESEPLKLTLLLSIVITGLGYVEKGSGVSNDLVENKSEIQDQLFEQLLSIIREDDGQRLVSEGLDGLEAVFILYATSHLWNGRDGFGRQQAFESLVNVNFIVSSKTFSVSPLSIEGIVSLVRKHGLDMEPQEVQPDGRRLSQREIIRRARDFWIIWSSDALSSFSCKRVPAISSDSFEIEPPSWGPQGPPPDDDDAEFDSMGEPIDKSSSNTGPSFDSLWVAGLLRGAFAARACSARLVTPRVKKNGILVEDCVQAINSYEQSRNSFPEVLSWKFNYNSEEKATVGTSLFRKRYKSLQLELMMRYHLLAIHSAVSLAGLKEEVVEATGNDPSLLPFPTMSDLDRLSFSNSNTRIKSVRGTPKCYEVLEKLERLTLEAFKEVVDLVKEAENEKYLRAAPPIFRIAPCFFNQWALSKVLNSIRVGQVHLSEAQSLLDGAQVLTSSIQLIDSKRDNEMLVSHLQNSFEKVKTEFNNITARIQQQQQPTFQDHNLQSFNLNFNESSDAEILDQDFLNHLMGISEQDSSSSGVGENMGGSLALTGSSEDESMQWLKRMMTESQYQADPSPPDNSGFSALSDNWWEDVLK